MRSTMPTIRKSAGSPPTPSSAARWASSALGGRQSGQDHLDVSRREPLGRQRLPKDAGLGGPVGGGRGGRRGRRQRRPVGGRRQRAPCRRPQHQGDREPARPEDAGPQHHRPLPRIALAETAPGPTLSGPSPALRSRASAGIPPGSWAARIRAAAPPGWAGRVPGRPRIEVVPGGDPLLPEREAHQHLPDAAVHVERRGVARVHSGFISTTSIPTTRFSAVRRRSSGKSSRGVSPPGSGVPVPGV